jgi:hypothetical protein
MTAADATSPASAQPFVGNISGSNERKSAVVSAVKVAEIIPIKRGSDFSSDTYFPIISAKAYASALMSVRISQFIDIYYYTVI